MADKNPYTLVHDMYKVIDEGVTLDAEKKKDLGERLVGAVLSGIGKDEKQKSVGLRGSSIGEDCGRKIWFSQHKPEAQEPLEPWVKFKFTYGHIIEALVLFLAKESGHKVTGEQDEISIDGVKGHRDAIVDGMLVDVKSANARAFNKFKDHKVESDDPFNYLDQLSFYLEASKDDPTLKVKKQAGFLAVDKEMGHIVLDVYNKKDTDYSEVIADKKEMLAQAEPPRRIYKPVEEGKSGNMAIPLKCSYCSFKQECWKDANKGQGLRGFFYSYGPKWLTHVAREPDVREIPKAVSAS